MNDDGNRWVRLSRGFYLLGIGTFLLLTTQSLLPAMFWADAAAYWPVLLVAIGIRLVFERSPFPWLVLLGPVVLLSLYSFNLRTNIPGTPTGFSAANWKDFLTGQGNPFRARFFYSLKITLLVSVTATIAAYPLAYYLAFIARRFRYLLLLLLINHPA